MIASFRLLRDDSGRKFGRNSAEMVDLTTLNTGLKTRGIGGRVVDHDNKLYWRTTVTTGDGKRSDRRIRLDLPSNSSQVLEAENRVIRLAAEIARLGILPDPLPWASEIRKFSDSVPNALTIAEAITQLENDFWKDKQRSSQALRTWDRLVADLRRLPPQATITTDLLVATTEATEVGSRTRLECAKVFKRLGKLAGLSDLERLDALRTKTKYKPKRRELPSVEDLEQLLEGLPSNHHWSWPTWALVTYGCRPSEVFSLRPSDDGTAEVLTVKTKNALPEWRTALALRVGDSEEPEDCRSWLIKNERDYDSLEAKRLTGSWGKWLKARTNGMQLYDLRHAWAVRSILRGINASLAAKCMGHSLSVHHSTYHRWLEQSDVAAVARNLKTNIC